MTTFANETGLLFTAANPEAVTRFDETIRAYATFRRDIGPRLKEVLGADPDMVMAHVLKGCFYLMLGLPALIPKAQQCLAEAQARAEGVTGRERKHIEALQAWCRGDYHAVVEGWEQILVDHPRDFLALKLANYLHFYMGDLLNVRDSVARVLYAWHPGLPNRGLVMSLYAFGLEENGNDGEAERIARASVEADPSDVWGIHVVAHVLESEGRDEDGIAWLNRLEPHWNASNNFRYHLWWHHALLHLDLGWPDEALRIYDEQLWDPHSDEYLDLCNDASLLLRLELVGVDVGRRWDSLFDKVKDRIDDHIFCFIDAHFMMALAAIGPQYAAAMLGSLRRWMEAGAQTAPESARAVGYTVCEALAAHRARDYTRAADLLQQVRYRIQLIGGSHTQRDLFAQLLLDALIRSGRHAMARALLSERQRLRPDDGWTLRASARLPALS